MIILLLWKQKVEQTAMDKWTQPINGTTTDIPTTMHPTADQDNDHDNDNDKE